MRRLNSLSNLSNNAIKYFVLQRLNAFYCCCVGKLEIYHPLDQISCFNDFFYAALILTSQVLPSLIWLIWRCSKIFLNLACLQIFHREDIWPQITDVGSPGWDGHKRMGWKNWKPKLNNTRSRADIRAGPALNRAYLTINHSYSRTRSEQWVWTMKKKESGVFSSLPSLHHLLYPAKAVFAFKVKIQKKSS